MKKKIIVVGGGFAGVQFCRTVDERLFDVLLVDKINHHQFQPLFYQVATSQLEPASISFPLRSIFRKKMNVQIRLGVLDHIDVEQKKAFFDIGWFEYDYLVLAMGCTTNFFGQESIKKHALTLKTTFDAITVRNHLMQNFENVLSAPQAQKESLLNLVIVGAGPTGVEMAGALAEIKRTILPRDFHAIDFSNLKIILIEGSGHTLSSMSASAQRASQKYLSKLGVKVMTETFVKDYDGENLILSHGGIIKTNTVLWAAGVTPNRVKGLPEQSLEKNGRIRVDRTNQVLETQGVYALGDLAQMQTPNYPHGHPQVANVALNQARLLALNLKRRQLKLKTKDYSYKDLGSMATLAKNKAVVDLPFLQFSGFMAWLVWMFLHLMLILSVRKKLIIFINWAWAYVTKDTALGLILKNEETNN